MWLTADMSDFELDFQNLNDALSRAERRREKFQEFQTLFFGVVVGAIVSAPLQLVLKPLSLSGGTVSYGRVELMTNLHPGQYFIIAMMFGFILIFILIGSYRFYIRLDFDPTVHVRVPDGADGAFDQIKQHLHDKAEEVGLEVRDSDKSLICYDPNKHSGGLLGDSDKHVLALAHRDNLGIVRIEFNQRDWRYKPLVRSLKEEYEVSS